MFKELIKMRTNGIHQFLKASRLAKWNPHNVIHKDF